MGKDGALILEKDRIVNELHQRLVNWDESPVEALEILEINNEAIESMQKIDDELTKDALNEYNKKNMKTWEEIIAKQKELAQSIRTEKDKVEEQLVQMGKKDKVVSNYISLQNKSAFIEENY